MTKAATVLLIGLAGLIVQGSAPAIAKSVSDQQQQSILSEIDAWSNYYGVSSIYLEDVALCEDPTLDPEAVSPTGDYGIFQWHFSGPSLWYDFTPEGQQGLMPWDVSTDRQIQLAVKAFSLGYRKSWSCA